MHVGLRHMLRAAVRGDDGIYVANLSSARGGQTMERMLRERVARERYDNYLTAIARNHSVEVMDHEVDRFLLQMPRDAIILDIGGCWGWHWRRLTERRPDVGVLIIDFVYANLLHSQRVLGPLVDSQIALMHADATALPFSSASGASGGFDGVWSVQVFQHIPDVAVPCREAWRVLNSGGRFVTYSLHATPVNRLVYRLFGKRFHIDGMVGNDFYLSRANSVQRSIVSDIFGAPVDERYTECFFHPDLKFTASGRAGAWLGKLDARLGGTNPLSRLIARQRSFEVTKR